MKRIIWGTLLTNLIMIEISLLFSQKGSGVTVNVFALIYKVYIGEYERHSV